MSEAGTELFSLPRTRYIKCIETSETDVEKSLYTAAVCFLCVEYRVQPLRPMIPAQVIDFGSIKMSI